jgi:DNA primase
MFTEDTLNDIRSRADIVETVSDYVQLKKSGQGYVGLCPFHNEKTPSFHVQALKQCFHCFGCHKGGNIFTFISAIEGLNFPETVKRLAKKVGVEIVEADRATYVNRTVAKPDAKLAEALEWAAKYFNFLLTQNKNYDFAATYLKTRGVTEKTIEKFNLGVSPKGWTTLQDLMLKRGFTFEELVRAGLVIPKENSPTQGYDRFRQRLMFPITDTEGKVIGFGARLLTDEDNQPKYINSPESPLFSKRKQLYGIYESQRGIRVTGEAVIVEGYMDVVGLFQSGVTNAVATMGTALTEDHCFQLKTMTQRVVTVFDPDAGGQEAWRRSVHLFMSIGLFAKDLSLPEGQDPDEFVLASGPEAFQKLCEKAPRQITKLLKEIASKGPLSEQERAKCLQELTPILVASRKLTDRAMLWDDIALVLNVSLEALKELSETAAAQSRVRAPEKTPGNSTAIKIQLRPKKVAIKGLDALDLEFFQTAILNTGEFLKLPKDIWEGTLREENIETWLQKLYNSGAAGLPEGSSDAVLQEIVQQETDVKILETATAKLTGAPPATSPSSLKMLIERIGLRKKENTIRALSAQVRLTQRLGDQEEQLRLLEKLKQLRSQ